MTNSAPSHRIQPSCRAMTWMRPSVFTLAWASNAWIAKGPSQGSLTPTECFRMERARTSILPKLWRAGLCQGGTHSVSIYTANTSIVWPLHLLARLSAQRNRNTSRGACTSLPYPTPMKH
jgi:hypothetical protein